MLFPKKFALLAVVIAYVDKHNNHKATQFTTYWIPDSCLEENFADKLTSIHESEHPVPDDWHPVVENAAVLKTKWRWV